MPNAQNTRPTMSSLCPGIPKKLTVDRSGMRRFASPPAFSDACAASAGAASARALSASNGYSSTRAARRTTGANQFIGKRLQKVRATRNEGPGAETGATTMIDASPTRGNASGRFRPTPQQKHRNAHDDNRQSGQRLRSRLVGDEQDDRSDRRQQDVQPRKPGISHGAIRALGVGAFAPQDEEPGGRQHVKHQLREDHVVEQLAVGPR